MNDIVCEVKLAKTVSKDADIIVLGCTEVNQKLMLVGSSKELDKAYRKQYQVSVLEMAQQIGAEAKASTIKVLPGTNSRIIVAGLGEADVSPNSIRQVVGNVMRTINSLPGESLKVSISLELSDPELLRAAGEGALLGRYEYAKVSGETSPARISQLEVVSPNARSHAKDALQQAQVISAAVCQARDWVNTPPNMLYPETFANAARSYLKDVKVSVEVWDEKVLEKNGFGGVLAVGGGSARRPHVVRLDYRPRGAKQHIALVGKGVTFDSGGLDIKPADGMYTMKCDMAGAAAVIATVKAAAQLGLKVQITAYAGLVENMPSGQAYRPSDVLTMYGGKTVENANTDAEGRLVMADLLARASEDNPDLIVDIATLTGACMVALGVRTAGVMASDEATADRLLDAAETAGETVWPLPIPEHLREGLDSKVADIRSGGTSRYGGASSAAAFLSAFVAENSPWAHLDIAGPAFNSEKPFDYVPAGGTGFGVRTLVSLAANTANQN